MILTLDAIFLLGNIPPLIKQISLIFGLAIIVLLVCNRFKIPTLLGFLITGVLSGPDFIGLLRAGEDVNIFADIGIILLLFTIGIEFSLKDLIKARRQVLQGGALQVFLTIFLVSLIGYFTHLPVRESIFLGMLFSLSSTAIVLKLLQDGGRLSSAEGRSTMSILIFQDIIVVPMMLIVPYLGGDSEGFDWNILLTILKGIFTVVIVIVMSRVVMPRLLFEVAKSKSSELFLLTIIVVCLSVAGLTAVIGLSFSLGAFLAGLIISESEYSHEAFSTILPFREVFTSFFFISIGLLVDINFIVQHPFQILGITLAVLIIKMLLTTLAVASLGNTLKVALLSGLFLCQVGEFSFILAGAGLKYQILDHDIYQMFLSVSIFSMAITPNMIVGSDKISRWLGQQLKSSKLSQRLQKIVSGRSISKPKEKILKDHLIIIGFGETGKNIAKAAKMGGIKVLGIDNDPEVVLAAQAKRMDVMYGNSANKPLMEQANTAMARAVVITHTEINDALATVKIVRKLNPHIYILAKSKRIKDVQAFYDAGADEVVSEIFETSVEIITRVLTHYMVGRNEIDDFVVKLRNLNYDMMRSIRYEQRGLQDYRLEISDTEIITIKVKQGSILINKKLNELNLRNLFGISILAIKRDEQIIPNPEGKLSVLENDILVIFGTHDAIDRFSRI
jgi:CPA2 family monovalent cation:H+ antiporter-2